MPDGMLSDLEFEEQLKKQSNNRQLIEFVARQSYHNEKRLYALEKAGKANNKVFGVGTGIGAVIAGIIYGVIEFIKRGQWGQ